MMLPIFLALKIVSCNTVYYNGFNLQRRSGFEIFLRIMFKIINITKSLILVDIITGILIRKERELRGSGNRNYHLIYQYLYAISATSPNGGNDI